MLNTKQIPIKKQKLLNCSLRNTATFPTLKQICHHQKIFSENSVTPTLNFFVRSLGTDETGNIHGICLRVEAP